MREGLWMMVLCNRYGCLGGYSVFLEGNLHEVSKGLGVIEDNLFRIVGERENSNFFIYLNNGQIEGS